MCIRDRVWAESVSEKNRDLALAIRLMASTIRHPEHSLSLILESGLGLLQDVRRSFSSSQSIEASDFEPPCGVSHEETLCTATPSAQELSSCTVPVEESSIADAELLESMLEESAPVQEHPSCCLLYTSFLLLTNVQLHISLRRIGGNSMDIQLVIVSLIVLAAVGYMVWRAKKARKGQCSCGCGGCGKSCKPKTL